jgi:hypothetical protein
MTEKFKSAQRCKETINHAHHIHVHYLSPAYYILILTVHNITVMGGQTVAYLHELVVKSHVCAEDQEHLCNLKTNRTKYWNYASIIDDMKSVGYLIFQLTANALEISTNSLVTNAGVKTAKPATDKRILSFMLHPSRSLGLRGLSVSGAFGLRECENPIEMDVLYLLWFNHLPRSFGSPALRIRLFSVLPGSVLLISF